MRQTFLAQVQADVKEQAQKARAKAKAPGQPKLAKSGKQFPLIEQQLSLEEFRAALAALPEVTPETKYSWPQGGGHPCAVLSGPCHHQCMQNDKYSRQEMGSAQPPTTSSNACHMKLRMLVARSAEKFLTVQLLLHP